MNGSKSYIHDIANDLCRKLPWLFTLNRYSAAAATAVGLGTIFGTTAVVHHYVKSPQITATAPDASYQTGYKMGYDLGVQGIALKKNYLQGLPQVFSNGFAAGYTQGISEYLASQKKSQSPSTSQSQQKHEPQVSIKAANPVSKKEVQHVNVTPDPNNPFDSFHREQGYAREGSEALGINRPANPLQGNNNDTPKNPEANDLNLSPSSQPLSSPANNSVQSQPAAASSPTASNASQTKNNSRNSNNTALPQASQSLPVDSVLPVNAAATGANNSNQQKEYDDGYNVGYNDGYNTKGYNINPNASDSWKNGYQTGYFDGKANRQTYLDAYNLGYADAGGDQYNIDPNNNSLYYKAGYNDGYNAYGQEYDKGYNVGYNDGYDRAYSADLSKNTAAYSTGYKDGYDDGRHQRRHHKNG